MREGQRAHLFIYANENRKQLATAKQQMPYKRVYYKTWHVTATSQLKRCYRSPSLSHRLNAFTQLQCNNDKRKCFAINRSEFERNIQMFALPVALLQLHSKL